MQTSGRTNETEVQAGGGSSDPRRRIHPDWFELLGAVLAAYGAGGLALLACYW